MSHEVHMTMCPANSCDLSSINGLAACATGIRGSGVRWSRRINGWAALQPFRLLCATALLTLIGLTACGSSTPKAQEQLSLPNSVQPAEGTATNTFPIGGAKPKAVAVTNARRSPPYQLIDILVYGQFLPIDLTPYSEYLRTEIELHRKRYEAYKTRRLRPPGAEMGMVFEASVNYERRLASMSTSPEAATLAESYVSDLRPCYEWEGGSECPMREAEFAATYQKAHVGGPFSQFLPLLEAHRWLCAAEGFDREKNTKMAAESREAYRIALSLAADSISPLVKVAASELADRNSCLRDGI